METGVYSWPTLLQCGCDKSCIQSAKPLLGHKSPNAMPGAVEAVAMANIVYQRSLDSLGWCNSNDGSHNTSRHTCKQAVARCQGMCLRVFQSSAYRVKGQKSSRIFTDRPLHSQSRFMKNLINIDTNIPQSGWSNPCIKRERPRLVPHCALPRAGSWMQNVHIVVP